MRQPSACELADRGARSVPWWRRRVGARAILAAVSGLIALGAWQIVAAVQSGGDRNASLGASDGRRGAVDGDVAALKVLADEWNERISTETFWRGRRGGNAGSGGSFKSAPSRLRGPPEPPSWFVAPAPDLWGRPGSSYFDQADPRPSMRSYGGLRTVCVRTCDGYFFPVSFGASEGNLGRDQSTCSNACPGARLFYSRAHGDNIDDMVDMSGQRYSRLPNANLFRTQYVESCKCKPHAWEEAAVERHRIYALEDRRRKGDRSVMAELDELKSKRLIEQRVNRVNNQSRKSRKQLDERSALPPATRAAAANPAAPAPRSSASRGQGGSASPERVASVAVTTGSIGTSRSVSDVAAAPARAIYGIEPSIVAGALAASQANAPQPQLAATPVPAEAAAAPAAAAVARDQIADAPTVAAPNAPSALRRTSTTRQAQRQRPDGLMGLGAGRQSSASSRAASAGGPREPSGQWVRQVFAF